MILEIKQISKLYQTDSEHIWANRDISFQINQGDFICLKGASGSGKSTLLNLITALDHPTKGEIIFLDDNIVALSDKQMTYHRKKNLGIVFQHFELLSALKGDENISYPLYLGGVKQKK